MVGVFYLLSQALMGFALAMLLPAAVAFAAGEVPAGTAFVLTAGLVGFAAAALILAITYSIAAPVAPRTSSNISFSARALGGFGGTTTVDRTIYIDDVAPVVAFTTSTGLARRVTGEEQYGEWAGKWCEALRPRTTSNTVFRSFLFYYGAALGDILLGDRRAREVALQGAHELMRR